GHTAEAAPDLIVLRGGQPRLGEQAVGRCGPLDPLDRVRHRTSAPRAPTRAGPPRALIHCASDSMTRRPSAPPNRRSAARSGWGISPTTIPVRFATPAIPSNEPLGFAAGQQAPPASQ